MHVCIQLSQPNEQGIQTCLQWQEQIPFALSNLTLQEAGTLSSYIILACVVAHCYKMLADFIKTHIRW